MLKLNRVTLFLQISYNAWPIKKLPSPLLLFVERSYWILKRPSHGKLKLANSCWETSKSWQTRTFTLQTRVKSQHTVIRSKANVKCHSNHANKALVLIGWHLPTHVCQSFTHQIQVYQNEKVGENRGKFYLSPTVCQRVCRLFLCRSHTPTWVCQHEFANFSLPCEGRLRDVWKLNADRVEECYFLWKTINLFRKNGSLCLLNVKQADVEGKRCSLEEICLKSWTLICKVQNKWIHHRCEGSWLYWRLHQCWRPGEST